MPLDTGLSKVIGIVIIEDSIILLSVVVGWESQTEVSLFL